MPGALARWLASTLDRRAIPALGALALTVVLGAYASRVRPDFSVEQAFPVRDPVLEVYRRYKAAFPQDDARALVIVEAPDIWTNAGLRRIDALERDLRRIDGVRRVEGPLSIKDVTAQGGLVGLEELIDGPEAPAAEIERARRRATGDPLFRWTLAPPDGRAVSIRVLLEERAAGHDLGRARFLGAVRETVARHEREGQRLVLSGLPVVRAEYAALVQRDTSVLFPAAVLVILVLLYATFRRLRPVGAALVTMLVAVVWTVGVMGVLGFPLTLLTQITPMICMIISVSDTVHIVSDAAKLEAAGQDRRSAVRHAVLELAGPCLLTEITIACGFLALLSANIVALWQFGIATAAGMMLTWLANVTVLPLLLGLGSSARATTLTPSPSGRERETPGERKPSGAEEERRPAAGAATRGFEAFIAFIERQVTTRPRAVVSVAVVLVVAAIACAVARLEPRYRIFDDLPDDHPLLERVRFAEGVHGGLVQLAVLVEPGPAAPGASGPEPMLEPEAMRLVADIARGVRDVPDVKPVVAASDYLRKTHKALVGPPDWPLGGGLPRSRGLLAKEVLFIDDGEVLRDVLSFDRTKAAVVTYLPDLGSAELRRMVADVEARAESARRAHPGYEVTVTGVARVADEVHESVVGGLARSFGLAIATSLLVFSLVLRSWRLGLIGLVPNLAPMALTFGLMAVMGIPLNATMVVVFSMTLVIADDDTIQYLARFRTRYVEAASRTGPDASRDPHREAALSCLRDVGLGMAITALAVAAGFATLMLSEFQGISRFGILVGTTLAVAFLFDLFISPILILKTRPRIGGYSGRIGS